MKRFNISTNTRDQMIDITSQVQAYIDDIGVDSGVCVVYVPHTTAGVTVNENADPDVIVSMAPSVYPWSKEEYLQDWPTWVNNGWVEVVCPQLYRYDIERYKSTLDEMMVNYIKPDDIKKLYPGILLKVGEYYPSEAYLKEMIAVNRSYGIEGEVFFFYEGLKKYPDLIKKEIYNNKVKFPSFLEKRSK